MDYGVGLPNKEPNGIRTISFKITIRAIPTTRIKSHTISTPIYLSAQLQPTFSKELLVEKPTTRSVTSPSIQPRYQ